MVQNRNVYVGIGFALKKLSFSSVTTVTRYTIMRKNAYGARCFRHYNVVFDVTPPEVFFTCFEDGHPTLFTIKLYHGGEFTKYPDVRYIDGTVNYVGMVDIYEFSVHELDAIMKGFRYEVPPVIYYHFLVHGGDFHFGLRPLGNDEDVANFSQYVSEHKVMKVYTEHGETILLTYFLNPKPDTMVTLVQLDEPHEDVQHNDEADDQSKESHVMTTPTNVVPTQPNQPEIQVNEVLQVISLSPEYNRRRVINKDGVMTFCNKKVYFDGIDETEQKSNLR
ncbi:unnamed protein product [Lactuca saligna]|uniref:PB1-like domain-containing protein n=1 Tax=Lactuca saligna TaxID=75948 RepID=A0AA36E163_LACSI|nr:unnamed protein product [Lactuca saligna]